MCLAVPGKIVSIDEQNPVVRNGRVEFGGIIKAVSLACVPEAKIGDYVIVHAGFALNILDEEQARITLDYLQQIAELGDLSEEEA
jgi:hydrogenase expression/formation protein HypC